MPMNGESTADHVDNMARILRRSANKLDRYAETMRDENDVTYAAEVMNEIIGLFNNLRLDLMVIRPIRECQRKSPCQGDTGQG